MNKIRKQIQKGFTLIELMIVVAIIGILAAIALPAYQDYTVRAKVTEPILAMSACKTSYTEYAQSNSALPDNVTKAGCQPQMSKYVDGFVIDARKTIFVHTTINTDVSFWLFLQPASFTGKQIQAWKCGSLDGLNPKYLPATCRDTYVDISGM
jgi:type IV pilus assembly protein PilA